MMNYDLYCKFKIKLIALIIIKKQNRKKLFLFFYY